MKSQHSSPIKRLLARILRLAGLEDMIRRALARRRCQQPLSATDFERVRAQSASIQDLMDIHPASHWHSLDFTARFGGFSPPGENRPHEDCFARDRVRSDQIVLLLRELEVRGVPGAMAELGVHRGTSARLIHHYCPGRRLYLFDTFEGFTQADLANESVDFGYNKTQDFTDTSVALVLAHIAPVNSNVIPVPGWFPGSVAPELEREIFGFVHLDADLEEPIGAGLDFFAPRLAAGGFILVHDYNAWPGARIAVDRFLASSPGWVAVPLADKSGSILLTRPRLAA